MLKTILGVIVGYAVFAVGSVIFFKITQHEPHAEASWIFKIATLSFGITISILGGFVTKLIARTVKANLVLAILMFSFALMSLVLSSGAHWTQWFAMLIFAPASMLGGYLNKPTIA